MRVTLLVAALSLLACATAHDGRGEPPLGAIDPEAVRKVIRDHVPQVRWCYEQELASHPGVEGKLTIRWHIDADGRTSNASVQPDATTIASEALVRCVMTRLATWEFPKPSHGGVAVVTYPWILRVTG